jgi:hypothetical protein
MTEDSVYYRFGPNSPGWIKRRLAKGQYVSGEDLARVERLHPGCLSDPVLREHNLRLLENKVKKPKGRPAQSLVRKAWICVAGQLVQEQIEEWRQGIGEDCPRKGRGELSLSEAAYEKFGRPLGLSGRALANAVSSLNSNALFGERPF